MCFLIDTQLFVHHIWIGYLYLFSCWAALGIFFENCLPVLRSTLCILSFLLIIMPIHISISNCLCYSNLLTKKNEVVRLLLFGFPFSKLFGYNRPFEFPYKFTSIFSVATEMPGMIFIETASNKYPFRKNWYLSSVVLSESWVA